MRRGVFFSPLLVAVSCGNPKVVKAGNRESFQLKQTFDGIVSCCFSHNEVYDTEEGDTAEVPLSLPGILSFGGMLE